MSSSGNAARFRGSGHLERNGPVPAQTHLRKKIEIILANHQQAGRASVQCSWQSRLGGIERHIAKRDPEAAFPQDGGGEERLQRRIWLHLLKLFSVVEKVIAVREKDVDH
jgi:hypothetical protein